MPDLGKHAAEVLLSYGITIGLVLALLVVSIARSRAAKRRLQELEND
ncbi:heme exporter protein CcmD [Cognatiyoonia sp.]